MMLHLNAHKKQIGDCDQRGHRFPFVCPRYSTVLFLAFVLSISPTSIFAQNASSSISSQEAGYDGSNLLLSGDVSIEHDVAIMRSQKARIEKQEENKAQPFALVDLEKDVHLFMRPHSHMMCDQAHFDFIGLKGQLKSGSQEQIVYTDLFYPKKNAEPISVRLQSDHLDIDVAQENRGEDKAHYFLNGLVALNNVVLSYGDDLKLFTQKATYTKAQEGASCLGLFTAYTTEHAQSTLIYKEQRMTADKIEANFVTEHLYLHQPRGTLPACFSPQSALSFEATALDWDQKNDQLLLTGAVELNEPALGLLTTQESIALGIDRKNKQRLTSLQAKGPSTLVYTDGQGMKHYFSTQGSIVLDRSSNSIITQAPSEAEPIRYYNDAFLILADRASIQYSEQEEGMTPSEIHLIGHVRLLSNNPTQASKMSLADTLVYSFADQICLLSSDAGKKVLFLDEGERMRLAAPQVQLSYQSNTKEPIIKGIGAVQFSFTPDEEGKIKHLFTELEKIR